MSAPWSRHGVCSVRSMVSAWSLQCPLRGLSVELTSTLWSQRGAYIRSMVSEWNIIAVSGLWSQHGAYIRSIVTAWSLNLLCRLSCGMEVTSALWSQHGAYSLRSMVSAWSLHPFYGLSMELTSTLASAWSLQCPLCGLSMDLASVLWSQHGTYIHSVVSAWNVQSPLYGLSMERTVSAYTVLGQCKHTHPTTVQHNRSALSLAGWVLLLPKVGNKCTKFTLLTSL